MFIIAGRPQNAPAPPTGLTSVLTDPRQHVTDEPEAMAPGLLYDEAAPPAGYRTYVAVAQDGSLVFRVTIPKALATDARVERFQAEVWDMVFPAQPLRIVR